MWVSICPCLSVNIKQNSSCMNQEWWGKLFLEHEVCLREIKTNKCFPPPLFSWFFFHFAFSFLSFYFFCCFCFTNTHLLHSPVQCDKTWTSLRSLFSVFCIYSFEFLSNKYLCILQRRKNTEPLEMSMNSRSSSLAFSTYSSHVEMPFTCQLWMAVYGMNLLLCRHEDNRCWKEWCELFTCA